MINFRISNEEYLNDLLELTRLFESVYINDISLDVKYNIDNNEMVISLASNAFGNFSKIYRFDLQYDSELERKRIEKRFLKISIYRTLSFLTGVNLPYGCLTGIRPTKLYFEIENSTKYDKSAHDVFLKDYSVSDRKLRLIEHVVETQKNLRNTNEKEYDLFVFIPFCPTRCAYCSFVSYPIDKQKKLVEPYVDCLIKEIRQTRDIIINKGITIRSVYIGGGTPTSIGSYYLEKIIKECHFEEMEFTVEAGRPDTINDEIIDMMHKNGVTRISINPQTFNDKTLKLIGRNHTADDVIKAYKLCKKKFDVNMDLIAMLPEESFEDFKYTLDLAIKLNPANITVHTLYLKKGSSLKQESYENTDYETATKMVDYAYDCLTESGYNPYYMYRQKYTCGNLENVGYAKKGKECIYNIDIMEEDTSILANGANAISKKYQRDINLITRCANYKEPLEYIKHFDEVLRKQSDFWNNK